MELFIEDMSNGGRPLLLVDHDGVVVDSLEVFTTTFADACRMAGIPGIDAEADVLALFEGNVYESMSAQGASQWAISEAVRRSASALRRALPWLRPFPLMREVIGELADARRVVIVTSNGEEVVRAFLRRNRFEGVAEIAGAESGHSKVEKIRKLRADYEAAGGDVSQPIWFVGDTAGDMREARLAGVVPVGVAWGWHSPEMLEEAGAEAIARTPADLLGIVAPEIKAGFLGLA